MDSAIDRQDVLEQQGLRKAICGYTWPGIEHGEPPSCEYTFFEYVDAVRFEDFEAFARIESAAQGWWFPTLDRGAGALLHFAVDHGRLSMVKFLVEKRSVEINQRDRSTGWTPLHRCAYVIHYRHAPHFEIFEYLLSRGADPNLLTYGDNARSGENGGLRAIDLVVKKGDGWDEGQVAERVAQLITKYDQTPKMKDYVYTGPPFGPEAEKVLNVWKALPKVYPPPAWRPPTRRGMKRFVDS